MKEKLYRMCVTHVLDKSRAGGSMIPPMNKISFGSLQYVIKLIDDKIYIYDGPDFTHHNVGILDRSIERNINSNIIVQYKFDRFTGDFTIYKNNKASYVTHGSGLRYINFDIGVITDYIPIKKIEK